MIGHQNIVWAVIALPNGNIVSGSADKTIKIWENFQCIKTISVEGFVRGLCLIPDVGFLCCGNLPAVQVWSYDGNHLYDMVEHDEAVYSSSILPNGNIVTASEDASINIWDKTEVLQKLMSPCGIWSVTTLENGDIVAGCQDRLIRIWTTDIERQIPEEQYLSYIESCLKIKSQKENLALSQKYKIGDIEYDHVIQVDLEEGQQTIPLGYNDNEPAYIAAERFVSEHNIPLFYMDEITKFIENSGGPKNPKLVPMIDPFRDNPNTSQTKMQSKFPIIVPILVETGQFEKIFNKITQLNSQVSSELIIPDLSLKLFVSFGQKLNPVNTQKFSEHEVNNIIIWAYKWPSDFIYPFLDLIRLGILNESFSQLSYTKVLLLSIGVIENDHSEVNKIMALRIFTNCFKWKLFYPQLIEVTDNFLSKFSSLLDSKNASISVLAISIIRNYATFLISQKSDLTNKILKIVVENVLNKDQTSNSILNLALYSTGTILENEHSLISFANEMKVKEILQKFKNHSDSQVRSYTVSILKLL